MKFSEFLKIRGSRTSYILMPIACIASFYIAFMMPADSISILFAMAGTFTLLSSFNIVHEHRMYKSITNPTFIIYERLIQNVDDIKVTKKSAVYGNRDGKIIYKRQFPGYLDNDEFESFSLIEKEIIEYPFKQAILAYQADESDDELTPEQIAHRNEIKRYTVKH